MNAVLNCNYSFVHRVIRLIKLLSSAKLKLVTGSPPSPLFLASLMSQLLKTKYAGEMYIGIN